MPSTTRGAIRAPGTDLRIAVISDIHACDGVVSGRQPSFLRVSDAENNPALHPIIGLKKLITDERIKADMLLCPGDFGDRALQIGIKYAWEKVHDVGKSLGTRQVFATAGNHDLDSRFVNNSYDPKEYIKTLVPRFPVRNARAADRYWANHFALLRTNDCRLIILGSRWIAGWC
jgi:predicted MPP superfamily phosphohydrolase